MKITKGNMFGMYLLCVNVTAINGMVLVKCQILYQLIIKIFRTYGFRKLSLPTEIVNNIEIIELFRKAQCAAYNALASIIFNTSCELKFFSGLLIREQEEKNEVYI